MKKIKNELNRVVKIRNKIEDEFLVSRDYKNDREWWILGHTSLILKEKQFPYPIFADKTKPPEPDFITYSKSGERFKPVEIGEILRPGRRRDEYKDMKKYEPNFLDLEFVDEIKNPWSSFISLLNDKFQKRYDTDCLLVIYHNIFYSEISKLGFWHNALLTAAKQWYDSGLFDLNKSPYERIIVINSNAQAMISLFPELLVISPETTPRGNTIIKF